MIFGARFLLISEKKLKIPQKSNSMKKCFSDQMFTTDLSMNRPEKP